MRHKILVVEDNDDARELLKMWLEIVGYDVVEAQNGAEAIVSLRRDEIPHLVLMDMSMPQMDGYNATRIIRQLRGCRNIPIIACTTHNQWKWRAHAIAAGCTEFIAKPIEFPALKAMLARLLPKRP